MQGHVFHADLLHRSGRNGSRNPCGSLICCYNTTHNIPYKQFHHATYTPIKKLDDEQVREIAWKEWGEIQTRVRV